MSRSTLAEAQIHPAARETVASYQKPILDEIRATIAANDVVVVGMKQNPFPRKVRKLLDENGVKHAYLEYGSYLSDWRRRLAIKMWTGWPTFPMVFVKGTFVGGFEDTRRLVASGELNKLLKT